jgi:hypothetical protein
MALILYRVMRSRLHTGGTAHSPERALSKLLRIQHHRITLNDSQPIAGLLHRQEQANILAALTIKTDDLHPVEPFVAERLPRTAYGSMTYAFNYRTQGARTGPKAASQSACRASASPRSWGRCAPA